MSDGWSRPPLASWEKGEAPEPERKPTAEEEARIGALVAARYPLLAQMASTRPWGCYAIFAMCASMFVWMTMAGGSTEQGVLIRFGADQSTLVDSGEYFRLWGATFLHIGIIHFAVNMYSLYAVGPFLEGLLRTPGFLALYAVAGLCGSLGTVFYHGGESISAGASGALFGVFGGIGWAVYALRDEFPPGYATRLLRQIIPIIVLNIVLSNYAGFDNAAHISGLCGGTTAALILTPRPMRRLAGSRFGAAVLLLIGILPFLNQIWVALYVHAHPSLAELVQ